MLQAVTSTLRSYDFFELESAAASLGANWFHRLRYILLPNLKHALIVGSLLVFTISLGEFNASFLLTTPINLTQPASLYDTYTNDSFQVSSAATSVFMLVVIPVLMAIQFVGGREMKDIDIALGVLEDNIVHLETLKEDMDAQSRELTEFYIQRMRMLMDFFRFARLLIATILEKAGELNLGEVTKVSIE